MEVRQPGRMFMHRRTRGEHPLLPLIVPIVLSERPDSILLLLQRWLGLVGVSWIGWRLGPHVPGVVSNTPGMGVPQFLHRPWGVSR